MQPLRPAAFGNGLNEARSIGLQSGTYYYPNGLSWVAEWTKPGAQASISLSMVFILPPPAALRLSTSLMNFDNWMTFLEAVACAVMHQAQS
jgi:hypothetical protein